METQNKIIMECEMEKKLHNNILITMFNEKLIKEYGYIFQSTNKNGWALSYRGGKPINYYAYLDNKTNIKVNNLLKEKERINKEITETIKQNENKLIPLTEEDVLRLEIKLSEKIKEFKKEEVKKQYKKDVNKNSIPLRIKI